MTNNVVRKEIFYVKVPWLRKIYDDGTTISKPLADANESIDDCIDTHEVKEAIILAFKNKED